ncbi:MAG: rod shape-determining protein MreC [Actinomycetota bacterium]|nr:rod shape-determining protein MreC [Actinomycetota bacterium]
MYRRAGRGRLLLLAFVALSIVVITLDFRQGDNGPLERAKEISSAIVTPIQRGLTAVFRPVGNFFSSVSELSSLRSENHELQASVESLQSEITEAKSLLNENARLRDLLDLDEAYPTLERVTATVISNAPANYKWAVTIDRGSADGITDDMPVIDPNGLVGKTTDVYAHTATVLLLIDPQACAKSRVVGTGFTGGVCGNGAQHALSLEFIDTDADVEVNDQVVTAGYDDGIFPSNIPVGQIVSVTGEEAASQQTIEVDPWVDFTALDFVQVITEPVGRPAPEKGK